MVVVTGATAVVSSVMVGAVLAAVVAVARQIPYRLQAPVQRGHMSVAASKQSENTTVHSTVVMGQCDDRRCVGNSGGGSCHADAVQTTSSCKMQAFGH